MTAAEPDMAPRGRTPASLSLTVLLLGLAVATQTAAGDVQVHIHNPTVRSAEAFPFTVGVPFARGAQPANSATPRSRWTATNSSPRRTVPPLRSGSSVARASMRWKMDASSCAQGAKTGC